MDWKAIRRREYNSKRYQRNRELLLRRNPQCAECAREGRSVAATELDHIVSIRQWYLQGLPARECSGLQNLQLLCGRCHERKTERERKASSKCRHPVFDLRGRRVA